MGGKALLLVIFGFSTTLLYFSMNSGSMSNIAVANSVDYYSWTSAHYTASAGANIGCAQVYRKPNWTAGFQNLSIDNSLVDVSVEVLDTNRNIRKITSISTTNIQGLSGLTQFIDTVEVVIAASNFSKYAYYSEDEGGTIYWASGDTVWGPLHTQDYLRVSGTPVFVGDVSTKMGLIKKSSSDKPKFLGDFSIKDLPINQDAITDLDLAAQTGGYKFTGKDTVYLTFVNDKVKYKFGYKSTEKTVTTSTLAPNGVIFVQNATLRLKGTVQGQFTIVCSGSGSKGDIYLDDNIIYKTNPVTYPSSTDLLGIVAQNDVIVTKNPANNDDIDINATIYCQDGSFGAQDYSTRPVSGYINLIGGIIQETRGAVGTFSYWGVTNGFSKRYRYDTRFMFTAPPKYPKTGSFEIVSWRE